MRSAHAPDPLDDRLKEISSQKGLAPKRAEIVQVVEQVLQTMYGDLTALDVKLYDELEKLAEYINTAKAEISAIRPDDISKEYIPAATDELEAIVGATEDATGRILDACESLENLSVKMSEEMAFSVSDAVTGIYEACNFQDLTGQRISKVVNALRYIEDKITALLAAFGAELPEDLQAGEENAEVEKPDKKFGHVDLREDADLLNGPQAVAQANQQSDIDAILAGFD